MRHRYTSKNSQDFYSGTGMHSMGQRSVCTGNHRAKQEKSTVRTRVHVLQIGTVDMNRHVHKYTEARYVHTHIHQTRRIQAHIYFTCTHTYADTFTSICNCIDVVTSTYTPTAVHICIHLACTSTSTSTSMKARRSVGHSMHLHRRRQWHRHIKAHAQVRIYFSMLDHISLKC